MCGGCTRHAAAFCNCGHEEREVDERDRDLMTYGCYFERDGKRIDPRDVYLKPPWYKRAWWWLRTFLSGRSE